MYYILSAILLAITGFVIYAVISFKKMKNAPPVEPSKKLLILTNKNFKNSISRGVTLIDFWAEWCMPCKMMAPILNDLAESAPEGAKICKLDVDNNPELAQKFGIKGIPTLLLLKDGKEIDRFVGIKQKHYLLEQIEKII